MDSTLVVSYPYERVLVVILSLALLLFLILAIVVVLRILKLMKRVDDLVGKAETIVEHLADVGETVKKAAGSLAIGNTLSKLADILLKRSNKHRKENNRA